MKHYNYFKYIIFFIFLLGCNPTTKFAKNFFPSTVMLILQLYKSNILMQEQLSCLMKQLQKSITETQKKNPLFTGKQRLKFLIKEAINLPI